MGLGIVIVMDDDYICIVHHKKLQKSRRQKKCDGDPVTKEDKTTKDRKTVTKIIRKQSSEGARQTS